MEKLSENAIEAALTRLEGWSYQDGYIGKTFVFADFVAAFGFLGKVGLISERLNHHPDWSGVYNKVTLRLTTHDAGGITQHDIAFAEAVERYG